MYSRRRIYLLSKKNITSLPLPKVDEDGKVHDAFNDAELRYRMRYVDLTVNQNVKNTFIKRTKLFNAMRSFLTKLIFIENTCFASNGGAAARRLLRIITLSTFRYTCVL
jgi:lysyl-tRNA synthetase class 2